MTRIGFVGFGEVASRLSAALEEAGAKVGAYDILLDAPNGRDTLRSRARSAGIEFVPLPELIAGSDHILSTVTTDVAVHAAHQCKPALRAGSVFVDLNATMPTVKKEIAAVIAPSGADFVEGAILGAIGVTGAKTRILVCGRRAAETASLLSGLGLNVSDYGTEIGKASTFKMLRSVFSKGIEVLLIEALLAAERAGMREDVWREIVETLDERPFEEVGGNWVRTHGVAHARRYHEMVQVASLVHELGLEPLMTQAVVKFFDRSRRLGLSAWFPEVPDSADALVTTLDAALKK